MSKNELNKIILSEKIFYCAKRNELLSVFTHNKRYLIWKYLTFFRKYQYFKNLSEKSGIKRIGYIILTYYFQRRKNIMGEKCNIEIANNCVLGRNINIYHGGIIISAARIGDNCTIRGNTVIGNKGLKKYNGEPTIGNNVEIGAGANIIGNITIADGCEIGANSVVTKSILEPNSIIVGVPGRKV